jgi:hypothetical protein
MDTNRAREEYKKIGSARCPYLKDSVVFGEDGWKHLMYKEIRRARHAGAENRRERLKHLFLAPEILRESHTLQGYRHSNELLRVRRNDSWTHIQVSVEYHTFTAIKASRRLSVIVRSVHQGGFRKHEFISLHIDSRGYQP